MAELIAYLLYGWTAIGIVYGPGAMPEIGSREWFKVKVVRWTAIALWPLWFAWAGIEWLRERIVWLGR